MTSAIAPFAYDDAEQRIVVEQRFTEAQDLMRQGLWSLTQSGGKFAVIRDVLAHNKTGGFEGWLAGKGLARRSIYRLIDLHASFGNCANLAQLDLDKSAAYLLAAPSTPEPARLEAIERAQAGEQITVATAREIVAQHRPTVDEIEAAVGEWAAMYDPPSDGLAALVNGDRLIWSDLQAYLPKGCQRAEVMAAARRLLNAALRPQGEPAPEDAEADPVAAALADWLDSFTTDRQRELALQDARRNGTTYQPALRSRLPYGVSSRDVIRAARAVTLDGEQRRTVTPDVAPGAPAATNGTGKPAPRLVVQPPPASSAPRDLSPDELRSALIELLTLPQSATNADILAAVATLHAAFEVTHA